MFDKSDILARLQNGDTAEDIANEMSNILNEAQKTYEEETKRVQEEEVEKERAYNAKRQAVLEIIDALCDYMVAAGEDEFLDELHEINEDKIIEMLDGTIAFAKTLEALKNLEFNDKFPRVEEICGSPSKEDTDESNKTFKISPKSATFTSHNVDFNPDAIIRAFLKGI